MFLNREFKIHGATTGNIEKYVKLQENAVELLKKHQKGTKVNFRYLPKQRVYHLNNIVFTEAPEDEDLYDHLLSAEEIEEFHF